MEFEFDVQDNQLHQSSGVHEYADRGRLSPAQTADCRCHRTSAELAQRSHNDDQQAQQPVVPAVYQADLRSKTEDFPRTKGVTMLA